MKWMLFKDAARHIAFYYMICLGSLIGSFISPSPYNSETRILAGGLIMLGLFFFNIALAWYKYNEAEKYARLWGTTFETVATSFCEDTIPWRSRSHWTRREWLMWRSIWL